MTTNAFRVYPYHWPILNPGLPPAVPRIAMPQFFSIQWDFQCDSWYYIGCGIDENNIEYTFNFIVGRYAFSGQKQFPQMVYFSMGVGSTANNQYHSCMSYGVDISDDFRKPAALTLPPVTDFAYDLLFHPLLGDSKARFSYTGGAAVGVIGAQYSVDAAGTTSNGDTVVASILLSDERGTLLEGSSGCVAPLLQTDHGPFTYEAAQPRLTIIGGTLTLGTTSVTLTGGTLWFDRQCYNWSPLNPPSTISVASTPEEVVAAGTAKATTLYRGMWIAIKLDSGASILVSPQWAAVAEKGQQWISGSAVGRPSPGGYGNLFLKPGTDRYTDGAFLLGSNVDPSTDWDFDVNILNPQDPESSPHWQSSKSGMTYGLAWAVRFSSRLATWGIPSQLYLRAIVEPCENQLAASLPFWEGAVHVYSDAAQTQLIGNGFAEQMGYN
jgi:hypothetical protein